MAQRSDDFLSPLTDLLGLDSGGVLSAEAELGDGHVVQDDVEVFRPLKQLPADQQGNLEDGIGGCQSHVIFKHPGNYTL